MASSTLIAHRGATIVERTQLPSTAPPPTDRWFPVSHLKTVETVEGFLRDARFEIRKETFALTRDNARMFATIDLSTPLCGGEVTLAVGIRNSTDKSLPMGFCAGNRVFCCDNLAFRSELLVARRHTRHGVVRFENAIAEATQHLTTFQNSERERIKRFNQLQVTDQQAESVILRSYERGIVSSPMLPRVIKEWRSPSYEDFQPRTFWSLENAFTTVLGQVISSNPNRFCSLTMQLQSLLSVAAGIAAEPQFPQAV